MYAQFLLTAFKISLQMMLGGHVSKESGNLQRRCWSCRQKKWRNPQNLANHQNPKVNIWLMRMMVLVFMVMIFLMDNGLLQILVYKSMFYYNFLSFCLSLFIFLSFAQRCFLCHPSYIAILSRKEFSSDRFEFHVYFDWIDHG